jgi:hypothetical protein
MVSSFKVHSDRLIQATSKICPGHLPISATMALLLLFQTAVTAADFNVPAAPSLSLTHGSNATIITYRGQTNYQFALYASSNSLAWTGLTTNLCTGPQMTFSDTNRPLRFYKAAALKTPQIYECSISGSDTASFALFARTNDTVALVGSSSVSAGEFANSLPIGTNNQYCGPLLTGRTGCIALTSNTVSGAVTNNGLQSGKINSGALMGNTGPFQTSAGLYSGLIRGCSGVVQAILSADGSLFLYADDGGGPDGGNATITGNSFTVATPRGAHYQGAINVAGKTIIGTVAHAPCGLVAGVSFSMTRSEKVF